VGIALLLLSDVDCMHDAASHLQHHAGANAGPPRPAGPPKQKQAPMPMPMPNPAGMAHIDVLPNNTSTHYTDITTTQARSTKRRKKPLEVAPSAPPKSKLEVSPKA
jgi:hypothetical protein